jgi:hypothetical protein
LYSNINQTQLTSHQLFFSCLQAMAAAYTEVSIDPPELLLRTDVAAQTLQLTLTNRGPSDIKYAIQHSPAVGVSLSKSWYRQTYDLDAPSAVVAVQPAAVIVPGNGKATVKVSRWLAATRLPLHVTIRCKISSLQQTNSCIRCSWQKGYCAPVV